MIRLQELLFSPINNKKYCDWFYYLQIISIISVIIYSIIGIMVFYAVLKENTSLPIIFSSLFQFIIGLTPFVMTFITNKILYSMCLTSYKQ
jgi:nucleoside recognition membrane protein YjiH